MRISGIVGGVILLGTFVSDGVGQGLTLKVDPGRTPGIVMDAFSPPQRNEGAAAATVTVEVGDPWSGDVDFQVTCCWDVIRARQVILNRVVQMQAGTISGLAQGQQRSFSFQINATGSAGRPAMPYGRYLVQIAARSRDGTRSASTEVGLTVLPDLILFRRSCHTRVNPPGHARAMFADSTTHVAVRARIQAIEQPPASPPNPGTPDFVIAIFPGKDRAGVGFEVSDLDLPEDQAEVVFRDPAVKRRASVAVGCGVPSADRKGPVALFTDGSMMINKATDPTLVIRMIECRKEAFGLCWGKYDWVDILILADEGFWDVFGGKQIKVVWHEGK